MNIYIFSLLFFLGTTSSVFPTSYNHQPFVIENEEELVSSSRSHVLALEALRAYSYLEQLRVAYEKAKLNQSDDDVAIRIEERQIDSTLAYLQQVVRDLQKEQKEAEELNQEPDLIIPLFLKCYNFEDPTNDGRSVVSLFDSFNALIECEVGPQAHSVPFFENLIALNTLMRDRIRMGIKIGKCYPQSSLESLKKGLDGVNRKFPAVSQALHRLSEINPLGFVLAAFAVGGVSYIIRNRMHFRAPPPQQSPVHLINKPTNDHPPLPGGNGDYVAEEPPQEVLAIHVFDPAIFKMYENRLKAFPGFTFIEKIQAGSSLVRKFYAPLIRVTFFQSANRGYRQLFDEMSQAALTT